LPLSSLEENFAGDFPGRTGCFRAQRGDERFTVCELIHDSAGGASWPDVSAWFWHAWFAPARSSWWSYVVAERS